MGDAIPAVPPLNIDAPEQLAQNLSNVKLSSIKPEPYTMDSKVSKENYLNYLELFLQDVPPEKWAVVACRMMTLDVLEMFFGSTMKTPDISQMTWEDFKTKFVALNTGPLITTIYGNCLW
jgi:hypothetical protein